MMSNLQDRQFAVAKWRWLLKLVLAFAALGAWLGAGQSALAQIYGYMPENFSVGDNLFCNPLDATGDSGGSNTLDFITVGNGWSNVIPNGTTVQLWDPNTRQYTAPSVFSASSQSWSIDYPMAIGQGAKLDCAHRLQQRIRRRRPVGGVWPVGAGDSRRLGPHIVSVRQSSADEHPGGLPAFVRRAHWIGQPNDISDGRGAQSRGGRNRAAIGTRRRRPIRAPPSKAAVGTTACLASTVPTARPPFSR